MYIILFGWCDVDLLSYMKDLWFMILGLGFLPLCKGYDKIKFLKFTTSGYMLTPRFRSVRMVAINPIQVV